MDYLSYLLSEGFIKTGDDGRLLKLSIQIAGSDTLQGNVYLTRDNIIAYANISDTYHSADYMRADEIDEKSIEELVDVFKHDEAKVTKKWFHRRVEFKKSKLIFKS